MQLTSLLALALSWSSAAATVVGFNYAANYTNGSFYEQSDFQRQFAAAKQLPGTNGMFTAARLYTTIQGQGGSEPTSAIPAAIATKTRLLLGLWASSGDETITDEISALTAAIKKYGSEFTDLVDGISVGSEDLYRITATSLSFDPSSVGASPDEIVSYIKQLRQALQGTALSKTPVGHVDTWSAWVNSSNSEVVQACDFLGTDIYSYYQRYQSNGVGVAQGLFDSALQQNKAAAQGKDIWITETAWPITGETLNQAVPSTSNAQQYWQQVGCDQLFGKVNTYWYTYYTEDAEPSFGLVDSVGGQPRFNLACDKSSNSTSTPSPTVSALPTGTGSAASSSSTQKSNAVPRSDNVVGLVGGAAAVLAALAL